MKYCAIIPARGGSKGIKNKNIAIINGVPLIKYTMMHATDCKKIDSIILTSDDKKIFNTCKDYKCLFIKRQKNISDDHASLEKVIDHTIKYMKKKNIYIENIILLQPTSPIRFKNDILKSIKFYEKNKLDSLFSSVNFHSLFWKKLLTKKILPVNYNPFKRKNRQNMNEYLIENGAIYIFKTKIFEKRKSRLFGKIGSFLMKKISIFEIDDKSDLNDVKKIINDYPELKWKK